MTALSLAIAGICFVLYPAIRPFSYESSLRGAEAFAASSWLLAHSLAMVGFILLTLGLLGLYCHLRETTAGSLGITALVVTWIGIGFTLPYYRAETFALHAVGQEAVRQNNVDLLGCWLMAWSVLNYRKDSVAPTRETERDRRTTSERNYRQ